MTAPAAPPPAASPQTGADPWRGGWGERLLDWLYPVRCCGCEAGISFAADRFLCAACRAGLRLLDRETSCRRCGAALGPHVRPGADCPECRTRPHRFTRAVAVAAYDGPARGLVHALKFAHVRGAARPLGALLADRARAEGWDTAADAVSAVPLHPARERQRGYNQSVLLARQAARALGLPLRRDLVRRIRETRPQALLGREERLRNPRGAFAPVRADLGVRACVLVDDVMTTGATVSACADARRAGGVERIYVAVAGR